MHARTEPVIVLYRNYTHTHTHTHTFNSSVIITVKHVCDHYVRAHTLFSHIYQCKSIYMLENKNLLHTGSSLLSINMQCVVDYV